MVFQSFLVRQYVTNIRAGNHIPFYYPTKLSSFRDGIIDVTGSLRSSKFDSLRENLLSAEISGKFLQIKLKLRSLNLWHVSIYREVEARSGKQG